MRPSLEAAYLALTGRWSNEDAIPSEEMTPVVMNHEEARHDLAA